MNNEDLIDFYQIQMFDQEQYILHAWTMETQSTFVHQQIFLFPLLQDALQ